MMIRILAVTIAAGCIADIVQAADPADARRQLESLRTALTVAVCPNGCASAKPVAAKPPPAAWVRHETKNFIIWHCGAPAQGPAMGDVCERLRTHLTAQWIGASDAASWTPQCELVFHPQASSYTRFLGAGSEQSAGCTTVKLNGGKVAVRRIDLRADSPQRLASALPHELTHVIVADVFADRQIPRWADEGVAVLAEAANRQEVLANSWQNTISRDGLFSVRELLNVQVYPDVSRRGAFYGQSASLVRFLVAQGTPDQFVRFVRRSFGAGGYDAALKDVYQIDGVAQLETLWVDHVRVLVAARTSHRAIQHQN